MLTLVDIDCYRYRNKSFSFKTFCTIFLLILLHNIIDDKCLVKCWSLQDTITAAYTSDQIELNYSIPEGVANGTLIGVIKSTNASVHFQPPYLIVPVPGGNGGGGVDIDLDIDQSTGEIRTAVPLDREERSYYSFIALPLSGVVIKVTITIEDINDNKPKFPTNEIDLEFPENSKPRDVKRTLPPARDLDLGEFGTQKYRIVSGNIGNAFRLLSHREKDDVLYLDLQVNGPLDRETTANYTLVIEALDGGQPQLRDEMTVRITILDHNDCEPVFSESHYYGNVAENVTIGTPLLRVKATDNDQADNGLITYSLHSKPLSGASPYFEINRNNGWIFVAKALDFEAKEIHELVVIARDSGAQPLETSALVSIRVTDVNDNQPTFSLLFLTENARPEIPENAKIGDLVARVSVNDADSSDFSINSKTHEDHNRLSVSLMGNDNSFGLTTQDNVIYLIVVTGPLDRDFKSKYNLTVMVTDHGVPPLNKSSSFEIEILKPIQPTVLPIDGNEDNEAVITIHTLTEAIYRTISPTGVSNPTSHSGPKNIQPVRGTPKSTVLYDVSNATTATGPTNSGTVNNFTSHSDGGGGPSNSTLLSGTSFLGTANSPSIPSWILFLIVLLMLTTVILMASIVVICLNQHQQHKQIMSDHIRHIGPHSMGSFMQSIGSLGGTDPKDLTYHSHHTSNYGTAPPAPPPCYNDLTLPSNAVLNSSGEGHSASSGRGSVDGDEVEVDMDDVDEEVRMINESGNYYREDDDQEITTTALYFARLGVINHNEEEREDTSTAVDDDEEDLVMDKMANIIDSSLSINSIIEQQHRNNVLGNGTQSYGSLSSILHSEEELSGSYNWDYLQNWGPKYLPLASVFSEVARLKASNRDGEPIDGSIRSVSTASSHKTANRHNLSVHTTPPTVNGFHSLSPRNSIGLPNGMNMGSHGEPDIQSIEAQMAIERASTRSSSAASSHKTSQQRHHLAIHNSNRYSHPMNPSSNMNTIGLSNGMNIGDSEHHLVENHMPIEQIGSTTRSSSAASSHKTNNSRHHMPFPNHRLSHSSSSPFVITSMSGFQSLSPLTSSPNMDPNDLNNGLHIDEEITI